MGEQLLVERAPIGADAHRLAVLDRGLDDRGELAVLLLLEADIAGIDAVFVERFRAGGIIGEQLVADVMEIADDRHIDPAREQPLLDVRHGGRRLVAVDRDAHDLGARARERRHLRDGRLHIGGVGVGHRLDDDRRAAAHHDAADHDRHGLPPRRRTRDLAHHQLLERQLRFPGSGQTGPAGSPSVDG